VTEGRNIRIDTRWAAGDTEAMQRLAKELVALQPELIVSANTPSTAALLRRVGRNLVLDTQSAEPAIRHVHLNLRRELGIL
jgi:putative ABC transport system substrate-binding protein